MTELSFFPSQYFYINLICMASMMGLGYWLRGIICELNARSRRLNKDGPVDRKPMTSS